jgi:hypothetical protein
MTPTPLLTLLRENRRPGERLPDVARRLMTTEVMDECGGHQTRAATVIGVCLKTMNLWCADLRLRSSDKWR